MGGSKKTLFATGIGAAFGGPIGAAVGATVGSAVDQADMAKKAADVQTAEIAKAEAKQAEQDKLVAAEQAKADAEATERTARMATGRRGLLYGSETGVAEKEVLGG